MIAICGVGVDAGNVENSKRDASVVVERDRSFVAVFVQRRFVLVVETILTTTTLFVKQKLIKMTKTHLHESRAKRRLAARARAAHDDAVLDRRLARRRHVAVAKRRRRRRIDDALHRGPRIVLVGGGNDGGGGRWRFG